jgi:hypothetical protein
MRTVDTSAYRGPLRIPSCWTTFMWASKTYDVIGERVRLRHTTRYRKPGKKARVST